jgi:hypothetical protein
MSSLDWISIVSPDRRGGLGRILTIGKIEDSHLRIPDFLKLEDYEYEYTALTSMKKQVGLLRLTSNYRETPIIDC